MCRAGWDRSRVLACLQRTGPTLWWIAVLLASGAATAQEKLDTAVAAQRFLPLGGAQDVLTVESADVARNLQWAVGAYYNFASAPVRVVRDSSLGGPDQVVLRDQQTMDLIAAIGLEGWLEIDYALPVTVNQHAETLGPGSSFTLAQPVAANGLGDTRLTLKARLWHDERSRIGLSMPVTLPTGQPDSFIGSGIGSVGARLLVEHDMSYGRVLLNAGIQMWPEQHFLDFHGGTSLTFGLGVDAPFQLGGQQFAGMLTVAGESDGFRGGASLPIEALLGARWITPAEGLDLMLGGGPGLTSAFGTPKFRVFAALSYRVPEPT